MRPSLLFIDCCCGGKQNSHEPLWCSYLVAALTKGGCHTFFCIVVLKRRRSHPWGALINTWLLYVKDHALLPCERSQNKELLRSHWMLVDNTRDQIHDLILIATTFAKHHMSFRSRKRQNFRRFLGATELKFSLGCVCLGYSIFGSLSGRLKTQDSFSWSSQHDLGILTLPI